MGLPHGILWAFGILLVLNSELTLAQNKRSSSRITSSRSFGTNIKGSSSSQSSLAGVNFDCPEEFGYYPHPNDCTQYYVCVFGGALLESCTGGLMYSHELQTCDWPRNVGCDLSDSGASVPVSSGGSSSYRDGTQQRVSQNKQLQQQPQHVPHRVRFGSAFSSSTQAPQSKPTIVQQYQPRQQQVIQAQVQSLPPPPELRVAPNPVITSRGQPKPLLDSNEDIAKLYADAHDTLPPVEEEESDRQQRVYRGQPSTVGQVQRDRDGIIHQASINSIPNHGKIGSYAYGAQINQYRRDDDVDTNSIDLHRQRREVQNVTTDTDTVEPERQSLTFTNQTADIIEYTTTTEESSTDTDNTNDDDDTTEPDDTEPDESVRSTRQLRPLSFNTRLNRWQLTSSNYRAVDSNPYQQQSFSFGAFNPYLTPPLNPHLKDLKGNPLSAHLKPKTHYNSLGYSITTSTQSPLGAYKPYPGYYATSTSRPSILQQSDILPFLLQSLKEIQQQKKQKLAEAENFSYFHLENEPVKPTKSISNTHYSQYSTVGGFFNNYDNQADSGFKPTPGYQQSKLISQYSIATAPVETTTESNYFQYNILQNQKMKNFFTTPTTTTAPPPSTSNFQIVSAPNLSSGSPPFKTSSTLNIPSAKTHKFSFENLTTTPLPATQPQKVSNYAKPGAISSNFNIGQIMSGVQYSNMEHMQPAIMDMIKYFRQTAGPAGHRGKATKAPSSTTTHADYEYYDEDDDLKTKKPTVNTKAPKGYESFIKSIPNQASKSQTKFTLKNVKNTTTRPLKSTDDYYYDEEDDYNIRHPPSEKPPYMPNSETMPPRPAASSTPKYKRPNSVTGYLDVTTRRPVFSSHFKHDGAIPSFINFPSDIFQDLRSQQNPNTGSTNNPFHRPTTSPSTTTTVTTTKRPYTSTTTRKVYTVRPNRGHSKWKYNKASEATKTDHRKRPTAEQRPQSEQDEPNRVESSSQAPPPPPPQQPSANIFISQQRPKIVETNSNGNRNYYNTSYETQQQQSYDPYYSVYDDDIDLYRDVEYSNQQQQHQQQQQQHQLRSKVPQQHQQVEPQRPTYRPEIIPSQPSPQQVPAREAYISKPIQKQQETKPYNNQQSLIYNTDYDEDLIAQIEQDNEYDQPTRAPIRDDRFAINSISDRPIVVSSTVDIDDEPFYASLSSTLAPPTDSLEEQEDPFDIPFLPRKPSPAPTSTFRPKVVETVPADEYSIFPNNQPATTTATSISKSSTSSTTPSTTTTKTTTSTTSSTTTTTTTTQTPPHYDTTQSTTTTKRSNRLRDDSVKSTTIKATPKSVILTFTSNVGLHNQSHKHKTNTDNILSQSPSETTPSVQVVSPSELKRESFEEAESVENKVSSKQSRLNSTKSRVSKPVEVQNDDSNQREEDQKERVVTERQRNRILSYIVSDVEPESFKPQSARVSNGTSTTTTTTTTTNKPIQIPLDGGKQSAYRFSISQGFRGFSFKAEETHPELKLVTESEEESHSAEVPIYTRSRSVSHRKEIELGDKEEETPPTTYTPIHSWRFSRTSPLPFGKQDSNALNGDDSDDSRGLDTVVVAAKENPSEDYVSSAGSERSVVTHQSTTEQTQSFTARASLFKDNLSRTYETTGPTKFVSPYKSLETILQEKEDSLKFNSIRSTPIPRTSSSTGAYQASTQKPFRSYFIITSPPRILNNTSPSTTVRPGQTTSFVWPSSSLPKTTSSTSTTTTTTTTTPEPTTTTSSTTTTTTSTTTTTTTTPEPETLPPSTAAPTTTIRLPSSSFRSKMRQEVSNFNSQARPRGRSRYTASFSNSVDEEPTTYSPKFRFAAAHYESTSYGPETTLNRRRPRPTVARQPKSTTPSEREFIQKARKQISDLENESYDKPRSEALIGPPVNKNENTYTDKPPRFTAPTPMTTTERVVEITDRPVQFYSKYRTSSTPERALAESLKNAGYLTNSRGKYRDLGFDEEIRANVQEITESPTSTTTTTSPAPTPTTIPIQSTTPLPARTTTTTPKPTTSTTLATTTTTTSIPSTTSASTKGVIPPRASRVNTAIKTSIAAASNRNKPLATSTFSKCADSTPNAKCNEIPSRTNSNNRNRGGSAYSNGAERDQPATVSNHRGTHPPRTRPTLKPSQTIVSKAQEFVDIYRNPPSRPEPLYPQPTPDKTAAKCRKDVCLLPDCYCGGKEIPADLPVENVPQIVLLTFDDSVNDLNKQLYTDLFEKGRVNPNGCPISATFYVSHEWTDYSQVQNLYSDGHEIASHTVSHSFGEQFSQKKWTREVAGQREILAAYGGVKLSDVRGMRAPFLSVGGNKMYKMLYDSNFTYDSSMPVYENRPPSWPYTLDYKIFHDCMIPPCPTKSYPGVWQVPMVMWQDLNGGRCSMGDACSNPGEAEGVYKMIMKNFERHYTTNRAPFGLFYHAAWFTQPHHKEGFIKFLDAINSMQDVWILTNWQALQWVRDPTPTSRLNSFQPFQCDFSDRPKRCNNPKVCNLWHKSGVRYMRTCQPCPDIYPWTGKTGIRSSRVDNDIEES